VNDPIVEEIRNYREAHAARFNYDLDAIYRDIKEREKEWEQKTGRKLVSYPPRRVEPPSAPQSSTPAAPVSANTTLPDATPAAEH
jgi:hypothetical protein